MHPRAGGEPFLFVNENLSSAFLSQAQSKWYPVPRLSAFVSSDTTVITAAGGIRRG